MEDLTSSKLFTQSVWKSVEGSNMSYFSNTSRVSEHHDSKLEKYKSPSTSVVEYKMGSLYMTEKGIGRLIKLDKDNATIKFVKTNSELAFPCAKICSDFNLSVKLITPDSSSSSFSLSVPANGTVELLKKKLNSLGIIDLANGSFYLIFNGKEILDDNFFDSLDFLPNSKVLICYEKLSTYSLTRFPMIYTYWYTYATDGITITVNKKIKLSGIGFFGSHESKTQEGTVKLFEGTCSSPGATLMEDSITIEPAVSQQEPYFTYMFKKPVAMKAGVEYTVQLVSRTYCYLYYGNTGQSRMEGEKGVEFQFKYTTGSSHGSNDTCGNFGQIHYMV